MPKLKYLLDTHAFIWAASDDERLGTKAAKAIYSTPYEQLGISDVSLQEVGMLLYLGRIVFEGPPAEVLASLLEHVTVLPISLEVAMAAPALNLPHSDQFDRIICATARHHRVPLISRDGNITDAGIVEVIW